MCLTSCKGPFAASVDVVGASVPATVVVVMLVVVAVAAAVTVLVVVMIVVDIDTVDIACYCYCNWRACVSFLQTCHINIIGFFFIILMFCKK